MLACRGQPPLRATRIDLGFCGIHRGKPHCYRKPHCHRTVTAVQFTNMNRNEDRASPKTLTIQRQMKSPLWQAESDDRFMGFNLITFLLFSAFRLISSPARTHYTSAVREACCSNFHVQACQKKKGGGIGHCPQRTVIYLSGAGNGTGQKRSSAK